MLLMIHIVCILFGARGSVLVMLVLLLSGAPSFSACIAQGRPMDGCVPHRALATHDPLSTSMNTRALLGQLLPLSKSIPQDATLCCYPPMTSSTWRKFTSRCLLWGLALFVLTCGLPPTGRCLGDSVRELHFSVGGWSAGLG